jgi:uncharacterized membrane protein YgaE (UPF0421/DUF939 family)
MDKKNEHQSLRKINYLGAGIAIGVLISMLFAIFVGPAFIGIGVAIGVTIGIAMNESQVDSRY